MPLYRIVMTVDTGSPAAEAAGEAASHHIYQYGEAPVGLTPAEMVESVVVDSVRATIDDLHERDGTMWTLDSSYVEEA